MLAARLVLSMTSLRGPLASWLPPCWCEHGPFRTLAGFLSEVCFQDSRRHANCSRALTYHAKVASQPSTPVVAFRRFEGITSGMILSTGVFVTNRMTAIARCLPSEVQWVSEKSAQPLIALKVRVPVAAQPTSFLLPKHPALTAIMALRKSPNRPRSDYGNGPGGWLGNTPFGMSTRFAIAIAIVHNSGQRMISHRTLFPT